MLDLLVQDIIGRMMEMKRTFKFKFWILIIPLILIVCFYILLWVSSYFTEPGRTNHRNKKQLNKLELKFGSKELITKLDSLERICIRLEQRQNNQLVSLILGNKENIWVNDTEINTFVVSNYDSLKLVSHDVESLTRGEFNFIIKLDKTMKENKITVIDFSKNYKTNENTKFYYRIDLCDNSYWCEREIVFSRKQIDREARIRKDKLFDKEIIDSLEGVYLLSYER